MGGRVIYTKNMQADIKRRRLVCPIGISYKIMEKGEGEKWYMIHGRGGRGTA
jgi:hypothetical protein